MTPADTPEMPAEDSPPPFCGLFLANFANDVMIPFPVAFQMPSLGYLTEMVGNTYACIMTIDAVIGRKYSCSQTSARLFPFGSP